MRITVPFKEMSVCAHSHLTLCDAMDYSPPGSSVHGFFQARMVELTFPTPGDLPDLGIEPNSPALGGIFFTV